MAVSEHQEFARPSAGASGIRNLGSTVSGPAAEGARSNPSIVRGPGLGAQAGVEMQRGFLSRSVDRLVANARVIRGAPEAILVMVIVAIGICGFGFQHCRERLGDLNAQLGSRDRLLTEYRTKLTEAETQIVKLTGALDTAEKRLNGV